MPISSQSFIRATILLLVAGCVSVLAIVVAAIWIAGRNDTQADDLVDSLLARREAFQVLNLILDAETGQRGYLLTHDEAYLQPYTEAVAKVDSTIAKLREIERTQPRYAAAIETLAARISEKLAELARTVEVAKAGRFDEAIAVVRTGRGKALMDDVRSASDVLIGATDTLVRTNTAALRESARLLVWVLAAGGFVILGVVGATSWTAWRYTRDLEMARGELIAFNATLEARVRDRTADVARANEEIQRFAYIVSHDLRSPLVNIMGFTSELQAGLTSVRSLLDRAPASDDDRVAGEARAAVDAEMPEAIQFIRSSTSKMDRLINAILKLSREGQRKLAPVHVRMSPIFEAARDSVQHQLAEAGAELTIVDPIPDLVTDRLSVEQIFGNIIDNAVKYLDHGRAGRIVVRGREMPLGIEFEVEDNGRGIAPHDLDRIFDLFRRAGAQDRSGEGIGLSHVRALVRGLGGTISVRSELNVGTTFSVRLPRILVPTSEGEVS